MLASGEFDLSVGLVTVTAVVAAKLIDGDPSNTVPVIFVLFGIGLVVGLVNGFCTTILRVPSFIVTLAMLLILNGAVFLWTGARRWATSPTTSAASAARGSRASHPRGAAVLGDGADRLRDHRDDLARAASGARPRGRRQRPRGGALRRERAAVRTAAFVISATSAVIAGILLAGFAGVTSQVGIGLEFQAITAAVLGGTVLGGGRGSVMGAMAGALVLEALFKLLNLYGVDRAFEQAFTGIVIVAAVAVASFRVRGT